MRRVSVVPYDPRWPHAFAQACAAVASAMGGNLLAIHHIGSTSVPGLDAKPIIDMLAVVHDLVALDASGGPMRSLGYEVMGEFGIPGRRYFRRDDAAGVRTHQIHAFEGGSGQVNRHLAFRDYLRAHPAVAAEYATIKRRLAAAHPNDIEAYMDGKDPFIKRVEADAVAWRRDSSSMI